MLGKAKEEMTKNYPNNNCKHKGPDRNPDYREGLCFDSDEYFCRDCGWIADLKAFHKDVCRNPSWCKDW